VPSFERGESLARALARRPEVAIAADPRGQVFLTARRVQSIEHFSRSRPSGIDAHIRVRADGGRDLATAAPADADAVGGRKEALEKPAT